MSNLLEKASILTTPTAYGNGVVNSIIPNTADGDFQFSRNSFATRVNENGLIETQSNEGPEEVQNGNFSELGAEESINGNFETDSDWIKESGWTISGGTANRTNTGTFTALQQNILTSGKTYKVTFTIDSITSGKVYGIRLGSNYILRDESTTGTYTGYGTANGSTLSIMGNQTFSGSIDNVSVKQVDPNDNWGKNNANISNGYFEMLIDGAGTASITQNILTIGRNYILKFEILEYTSGLVGVSSAVSGVGFYPNAVGSFTLNFVAAQSILSLVGTEFGFKIDNISIIEVIQSDIPRIDYTNGCGELLLEPASTNLVTYSEDFSQWTFGGGITVESGYLAPDGSNSAYRVSGSGGALSFAASATQTQTRTIYAKTVSGTGQAHLCSYFGNTNNLFTITDQWQRFEVNGTTTPTGSATFYGVDFRGSTNLSEIIVWGAQLEDLTYATSYIPTTSGSTVTRAAETLNNAGNSDLINSTEGTLYLETKGLVDIPQASRYISLSKNGETSFNNSLVIQQRNNGFLRIYANDTGTVDIQFNVNVDFTQNHKIAVVYKLNGYKLFIDGVAQNLFGTPTQAVFSGLDNLSFDLRGSSSSAWTGNIKCVAVFKEALSDTELASLTTI